MKIRCIPRLLVAGFRAICTRRGNTAAEIAAGQLKHFPTRIGQAFRLVIHRLSVMQGQRELGERMNKYPGESPSQSARMNRQRLAPLERPAIMEEIDKNAADIRANMARLRELRLAKEAQEVRTEISAGNQPTKAKTKKAVQKEGSLLIVGAL